MSGSKHWCLKCRKPSLTHHCNIHGSSSVFHHSDKLRVPNFKNKARFRKFVTDVSIFFNCVTEEQKPLLIEVAKDLKLKGNVNGRIFN